MVLNVTGYNPDLVNLMVVECVKTGVLQSLIVCRMLVSEKKMILMRLELPYQQQHFSLEIDEALCVTETRFRRTSE